MSPTDWLMTAKVLILVAAGGGFAWWQLRDLAKEKRLTDERLTQERSSQNAAAKDNG